MVSTEGLEYLVVEKQLDPIRDHARWGEQQHWPVSVRRIYNSYQYWKDSDGKSIQMVHEFDILHTESNEWYFILAIFGLEFAINYGGPEVDGYLKWLDNHNHESPLYYGKNAKTDDLLPFH